MSSHLRQMGYRKDLVVMTQLFAYFTAETTAIYFPGVSFLAAAFLSVICLILFALVVVRSNLTQLGKVET